MFLNIYIAICIYIFQFLLSVSEENGPAGSENTYFAGWNFHEFREFGVVREIISAKFFALWSWLTCIYSSTYSQNYFNETVKTSYSRNFRPASYKCYTVKCNALEARDLFCPLYGSPNCKLPSVFVLKPFITCLSPFYMHKLSTR